MAGVGGRRDRRSFAGRSVVVTGAASGIGRAMATELVERGAHVVLTDADGEAAERAAGELAATGEGSATSRLLDVRDLESFRAVVAEVVERDGSIDYLFANAGVSVGGVTHEFSAAHWDRAIDVNLRGVVNGVLAAYPAMVDQGRGHIVATASAAGLVAPPFVVPYAATKHAVVGLCTGLRPEAALRGVRVSVLCPGAVETPILDQAPDADLPATASESITARRYLGVLRQKPVPADRIARRALAHVARNTAVIVVPTSARSLWYLGRLSPRVTRQINTLIARRVDRTLIRPRSVGGG